MRKFVLVLILMLAAAAPLRADDALPRRDGIIERAFSWIGVRYRFGSSDREKGVDCAGLVRRVFAAAGVDLPRSAAAQFAHGIAVTRNELCPGDLVFFRNTYKRGISHVGIYIGENKFVHATSSGRSVGIDRLDNFYYLSRFAGGRRVVAD